MKIVPNNIKIFNHTPYPIEEVEKLHLIKQGKNMWRQRDIKLYKHPLKPHLLISDGTSFDGTIRVISEDLISDWWRELGQSGDFVTE